MTYASLFISAWLVCFAPFLHRAGQSDGPLTHTRNEFRFTVEAPYKTVAPLFGPDAECAWGGSKWSPVFIHPRPAADIEGSVFTVQHGDHRSVWVTTALDLKNGHVQYVYVMEDLLVTLIDIHIERVNAKSTAVRVVYERTALKSEVNEHVKRLGESDGKMSDEWASAINDYLSKSKK